MSFGGIIGNRRIEGKGKGGKRLWVKLTVGEDRENCVEVYDLERPFSVF